MVGGTLIVSASAALDRVRAAGLLVVARSAAAHRGLQDAIRKHAPDVGEIEATLPGGARTCSASPLPTSKA